MADPKVENQDWADKTDLSASTETTNSIDSKTGKKKEKKDRIFLLCEAYCLGRCPVKDCKYFHQQACHWDGKCDPEKKKCKFANSCNKKGCPMCHCVDPKILNKDKWCTNFSDTGECERGDSCFYPHNTAYFLENLVTFFTQMGEQSLVERMENGDKAAIYAARKKIASIKSNKPEYKKTNKDQKKTNQTPNKTSPKPGPKPKPKKSPFKKPAVKDQE